MQFTIINYSESIKDPITRKEWAVKDNKIVSSIVGDIPEDVLGFNLKDLKSAFTVKYTTEDEVDVEVSGYISPASNTCVMNTVTTTDKDGNRHRYYRTHDIYGDGTGYIVTSSILQYLIADNFLIGVEYEEIDEKTDTMYTVGKIDNTVYRDSINNLYCRDTVTKWGYVSRLLIPDSEVTTDGFQKIYDVQDYNEHHVGYAKFKSDGIRVGEYSPTKDGITVNDLWYGMRVKNIPVAPEVIQEEGSMDKRFYDSWSIPVIVRDKRDILPLLEVVLGKRSNCEKKQNESV